MTQTLEQLNRRVHRREGELRTPPFGRLPVTGVIRSPTPHSQGDRPRKSSSRRCGCSSTPCRPLRFLKRLPLGCPAQAHFPALPDEGMRRRTTLQGITVDGHGVHTSIEDRRHRGT